jgi:uncharacterized membrane protein
MLRFAQAWLVLTLLLLAVLVVLIALQAVVRAVRRRTQPQVGADGLPLRAVQP